MKQHLSAIISAVSVVVAALCLFRVMDLETRIHSLENDVNNGFSRIEGTVNGISYNVRSALEEQTKILSASDWEYAGYDAENRTAKVTCSVTPKEYRPGKTTAALLLDGKEIPMQLENGAFTATFAIPLFENTEATQIAFTDDDVIRTESLGWSFYPRNELLPTVYADHHGSVSFTPVGGKVQWSGNGVVEVNLEMNSKESKTDIVSLQFLRYLDGTLTETIDMLANKDELTVEKSEYHHFYSLPLERKYEIPFGSTQKLYVAAQDAQGLYYVTLIDQLTIDSKGSADRSGNTRYWESNIYDEEGNLIYAVDESLYE